MDWNILQSKFTQGELSPLWLGQVQAETVRDGCQSILNGVVSPQGLVQTRMGTNQLINIDSTNVRLWPFLTLDNEELIAAFYDNQVSVLNWETGIIGGSSGILTQIITNVNFTTGLDTWNVNTYEIDEGPGGVHIYGSQLGRNNRCESLFTSIRVAPVLQGYQFPSLFLWRGPDLTTTEANELILQGQISYSVHQALGGASTGPAPNWQPKVKLILGTTEQGNELGERIENIEYLNDRVFSLTVDTSGSPLPIGTAIYATLEFWIEATDDTDTFLDLQYRMLTDNVQLFVRSAGAASPVTKATPYSAEELEDLHFLQSPLDNRELIVLHPDHEPQALYYDQNLPDWVFEPYGFTSPPAQWGPNKWPSIGAGAQGRLFLSGVETDPEYIWASKVYDWHDFSLGTSQPNDALELLGIERDINTWIIGGKNVLYGDRRREYSLLHQGPGLAPDDAQISVQTAFGTERNPQKLRMGKSVVLSAGGNNDLRLQFYNDNDGGFIAPNIVLKAEHLGKKEFRRHFYTRDPNQILWNVMRDGTVIMCSFDDEYNIQAWSRFVTDGVVIDGVSLINSQGRNVVMLAVLRNIGNESVLKLETIQNLRDSRDWLVTDSSLVVLPPADTTGFIAGFDELEGREVAVFLDGKYDGNQIVSGGQIYLAEAASRVVAGIPFDFEVKTFPQSSMDASQGLTAKKRFSKVGIRGAWTVPPIINGQRPQDRSPQALMNVPEPVPTFIDSEVVDGTTDELGVITISENLPLRVAITAIFGKLTSNQL